MYQNYEFSVPFLYRASNENLKLYVSAIRAEHEPPFGLIRVAAGTTHPLKGCGRKHGL